MYEVINPNTLFHSKTYVDYLEMFWNWLYSVNCDKNNLGDVVFLRGVAIGTDPTKGYVGAPVINVADNALTISQDQGVFFCNITTNTEAIYEREQYSEPQLRAQCIANLSQSTMPTEKQIRIDGHPIRLPAGTTMDNFRIVSSQYILTVPDPRCGEYVGPYMDVILNPGEYRCIASAYCFLVRFNSPGLHVVYSIGKGRPWMLGDYVSEYLYEIRALDTKIPRTSLQSDANFRSRFLIPQNIYSHLQNMKSNNQIDGIKLKFLKEMIKGRENI
jgi:hypothetical protein